MQDKKYQNLKKKQVSKERDKQFSKRELEAESICLEDYMTAIGTVMSNPIFNVQQAYFSNLYNF